MTIDVSRSDNTRLAQQKIKEFEALIALYHNPEMGTHLQRMARYAELIAKNRGLSATDQALILKAVPLHDIGKLGLSVDILMKTGEFTPQEFEKMQQHPTISYDMLRTSNSPLMRAAADLALTHHEQFNGEGYPNGLKGEDIPLFGRITAVADVFDALTTEHLQQPAWSLQRAIEYLQEQRGEHFDPACVDAFLADLTALIDIHNSYNNA